MSAICKCGKDAGSVTCEMNGVPVVSGWLCSGCFDAAYADMLIKRGQFQELIDAGVPRDKANEIMIARLEGAQTS